VVNIGETNETVDRLWGNKADGMQMQKQKDTVKRRLENRTPWERPVSMPIMML
jgi:hypothetical protein